MFDKVAVATDGSPSAVKAVQAAAELASKYGSELTVLHVLMDKELPDSLRHMAEIEHIVQEEPRVQVPYDNIPGQMISLQVKSGQRHLDHEIITSLGEKVIDQAKNKAHVAGVKSVKGEVLEGDSADQIVAAANRNHADLLVMGSRGLGSLKGVLMGSVSQKVSQESDCDCLIIK